MACELRGGTDKTDALPAPTDWATIYLEQLTEKNLRIAELEAALQKWRAQPERDVHDPWVVISAREIDDLLQKTPRE